MMEIKQEIINAAGYLFTRYGVRSVTMDDIAREISVSKKTIYQHFKDKDEIVTIATAAHMEREKAEFNDIYNNANNAIEELAMISKCMRKNILDLNPSLIYDLQKYHRNAWDKYLIFKDEFIKDHIKRNLERGINEDHYRNNINSEILAICRMEQIQLAFDDKVFPKKEFDFKNIQLQLFEHFVYGIVTEKGKAMFEEYLQKQSQN